jgi:hypothetical protein
MTRTWMAMLAVAGGLNPAMFGQQYPQQQYPPQQYPQQYPQGQVDRSGNGPDRYPQYDNGQYPGDPNDPAFNGYPGYDGNQGDYAPAPPPIPSYAYQRPPMPGPGYYWVDGYWNFIGGRYAWVGGYWAVPPYTGGYWVAPRYSSGRFFRGFWGGGRRDFNRGFVRNNYGYRGYAPAPRQNYRAPSYRAPAPRGSEFGGSRYRDSWPANRGQREGRR